MARLNMVRFYVLMRWVRLTTRRYGAAYLVRTTRPRHAACGRGIIRDTGQHGAMTGWNLPSGELVAVLRRERELVHA